jgi:TonB family protein
MCLQRWLLSSFVAATVTLSLPINGQSREASNTQTAGVEILSDTRGADLRPYVQGIATKVRTRWHELIPQVAGLPLRKAGRVSIEFKILKSGSVKEMRIVESSGDGPMDQAAWFSILRARPFVKLPADAKDDLEVRFQFTYNPDDKPAQN